jgi:hypothetical protein
VALVGTLDSHYGRFATEWLHNRPNNRFNPTCVRRGVSGNSDVVNTHPRGLTLALGASVAKVLQQKIAAGNSFYGCRLSVPSGCVVFQMPAHKKQQLSLHAWWHWSVHWIPTTADSRRGGSIIGLTIGSTRRVCGVGFLVIRTSYTRTHAG